MPDNVTATGSDDRPRGGQGFPQENPDGSPALIGPDEYTRSLRRQFADRERVDVLAGNLADLQRLGAQAATTGSASLNTVVAAPPGVDPKSDQTLTPTQAAAQRGEYDRETEREGLLSAPPTPDPPENREANSVDPTSVSPKAEGGRSAPSSSTSPTPQPKK